MIYLLVPLYLLVTGMTGFTLDSLDIGELPYILGFFWPIVLPVLIGALFASYLTELWKDLG